MKGFYPTNLTRISAFAQLVKLPKPWHMGRHICMGLAVFATHAMALDAQNPAAETVPRIWLNAGFYSYHFDRNINLRDNNLGWGAEYRYRADQAWALGRFNNSDWQKSNYVGRYWQPWRPFFAYQGLGSSALQSIQMGAAFGLFNGYPKAHNGGWLPAIIPAISAQGQHVGFNLLLVPGYADKLRSSISVQIKLALPSS